MPRKKNHILLPVLPLRGMMVFPNTTVHFDVGRPKSLAALEAAMEADQQIVLVAQRSNDCEDPHMADLFSVGTIATVKQVMNLPGDALRILVEGNVRAAVEEISEDKDYMIASLRKMEEPDPESVPENSALARTLLDYFKKFAEASGQVSQETVEALQSEMNAAALADAIASNVLTRFEDRQSVLETVDVTGRAEKVCAILARESELADIEKQIQARVKKQIDKNQKDYYLREQIRAIQTEMGESDGTETDDLRKRMEETPLNEEARQKCEKEIERLGHMAPGTPEVAMARTYIEWILDLPWGKCTEDNLDLDKARKMLEEGHYGLKEVKERIIEYLAVLKMKQNMRGPILCFVGPPGVGKTSIVHAIADAIGRKYVQMSLGGVRDEAEIRGHRRTYIGAIPGRIISGMKQAGTMNPVFLFDEIDKVGSDSRGDPASALLEVLDSEQNSSFRDHYMELPFDLSKVMFITTANTLDTIPAPLLDRMEVIEVPSYTEEEKLQIAKRHLLPKQIEAHGLQPKSVKMSDAVMKKLIEGYTREAGVRTLERTIAKVVRKSVVTMLDTDVRTVTVTPKVLETDLGAPRFIRELPEKEAQIGIVNGLAYTTVGGETLQVECSVMPGKGTIQLTGQLGDVMKESAEAALTYLRSHHDEYGLPADFTKDQDVHIHVPEGAVPKDGPSAGVTMTTALVSAFAKIPVKQTVAMTGEITLRGRVLPIGGLKEKTLAAYRAGLKTLIIPKENVKDLEEIPDYVKAQFEILPVENVREVLNAALERKE